MELQQCDRRPLYSPTCGWTGLLNLVFHSACVKHLNVCSQAALWGSSMHWQGGWPCTSLDKGSRIAVLPRDQFVLWAGVTPSSVVVQTPDQTSLDMGGMVWLSRYWSVWASSKRPWCRSWHHPCSEAECPGKGALHPPVPQCYTSWKTIHYWGGLRVPL